MTALALLLALASRAGASVPVPGNAAYVACEQTAVDVVNLTTNLVQASITTDGIHQLLVSPNNSYVYYISDVGFLHRVKTSDLSDINVVSPVGTLWLGMAPNGSVLYFADVFTDLIYRYDGALQPISSPVAGATAAAPSGMAVSLNGSFLYTGNSTSASVSKINTNSWTYVSSTLFAQGDGFGAYVERSLDGSFVFATDGASWQAKYRTSDDAITNYIQVTSPFDTVIRPGPVGDTTHAYAISTGNGAGADLDTLLLSSWTITASVHFPFTGNSFTFNPSGTQIWIPVADDDTVKVYAWPIVSTPTPIVTIAVDHPPRWVLFANTPAVTPTVTSTATKTSTGTRRNSSTITVTKTPTATRTRTGTEPNSATVTRTRTITTTKTRTRTEPDSATPTISRTVTSTKTPTGTKRNSATRTATSTRTASRTPTATPTP